MVFVDTAGPSVGTTLALDVNAGDLIVVFWNRSSQVGVSDDDSNTYTTEIDETTGGNNVFRVAWAVASQTGTITLTFGALSYCFAVAVPGDAVDVSGGPHAIASGTNAGDPTPTTGTLTTTVPCLVFKSCGDWGVDQSSTVQSGWTDTDGYSGDYGILVEHDEDYPASAAALSFDLNHNSVYCGIGAIAFELVPSSPLATILQHGLGV